MSKLKTFLQKVDENLNKVQPKTMDELIDVVARTEGGETYGYHFSIVRYMGYLQGIRVHVTGRSKTHVLPSKDKVYSTFQGIEKYEKAGWWVEEMGSTIVDPKKIN